MTDESWAGWYRDRDGSVPVTLSTDGRELSVRIQGTEFTGASFDALRPTPGAPPGGLPDSGAPTTTDGVLTDCVLEWDLRLPVVVDGAERRTTLSCLLSLRRADPDLHLALHLDGAVYESQRAERDFAAALAAIQRLLPSGVRLRTCIACAFSDYFPAPVRGFSGNLACFRGAKDAYRDTAGGEDLRGIWDRRTGFVQELWSCAEFEERPGEGAGTGHRGAFPLEMA